MPVVSPSCYELLGVPVDAPRRTLSRAWAERRRAAVDRADALDEADVDALTARLDEAFRILADPEAARRYRMYRDHVESGRSFVSPHDFASLAPDEVVTHPGVRLPAEIAALDADLEDTLHEPVEADAATAAAAATDPAAVTTPAAAAPAADADPALDVADPDEITDEWELPPDPDDGWDVVTPLDDEDDNEVSRTDAMAPAFPGGLGLLADVVLAVPASFASPADEAAPPRRHLRAPLPPWALDPPEPDSMQPPVHATTRPSGEPPRRHQLTARTNPGADRPPWER